MKRKRSTRGTGELDLNQIAAYLDGTLSAGERAEVERLLLESEPAREVVVEAIRLLDDDLVGSARPTFRDGAGEGVLPLGRRLRRPLPLTLAAAAVAAVTLLPFALRRSGAGGDALATAGLVVGAAPGVVSEGWDRPGWTVVRAEGSTLPLERAAFRAGVRWTDAAVAWRAGAHEDASRQIASLRTILEGVPLGGAAVRAAEAVARGAEAGLPPEEASAAVAELEARLHERLGGPYLELGLRLEAVRLAARSGGEAFVFGRETRRALALLDAEALPERARARLADLQVVLDGAPGPDVLGRTSALAGELVALLGG